MEQAVINERNRKAAAAAEASRKRTISALSDEASDAKRLKTEHESSASVASVLSSFDFTALPHSLVTDLIVANLQALTDQALATAVQVCFESTDTSLVSHFLFQNYKQANGILSTAPTTAQTPPPVEVEPSRPPGEKNVVKAEPVDPLAMDMGDEEVDYEPDRLNEEVCTYFLTVENNKSLIPQIPQKDNGKGGCTT